jgi:hypothetical protein
MEPETARDPLEADMQKGLCIAAMAAAGLLLTIYGLDLAVGWPFDRKGLTQDIVLIIASGLVIWQGIETWREMS